MEVIFKKERYATHGKTEVYNFNNVFYNGVENGCGLAVCYAILACEDFKFHSLKLYCKEEKIGAADDSFYVYIESDFFSRFPKLNYFVNMFSKDEDLWYTLNIEYLGIDINISGYGNGTEIKVMYPNDKEIDLESLFKKIETSTHSGNICGKEPKIDQRTRTVLIDVYKKAIEELEKEKC